MLKTINYKKIIISSIFNVIIYIYIYIYILYMKIKLIYNHNSLNN